MCAPPVGYLGPKDELLTLSGRERCRATNLGHTDSDCQMARLPSSSYCMYHDKVQRGLLEPNIESYPVWPLPKNGYVLLVANEDECRYMEVVVQPVEERTAA
jgi:hypothetical protein